MRLRPALRSIALALLMTQPALAIDPPYQSEMERLAEILGSLYFLQPLCQPGPVDWRVEMEQLIALDQPDEDRRQRLAGAFNSGFTAYSRTLPGVHNFGRRGADAAPCGGRTDRARHPLALRRVN